MTMDSTGVSFGMMPRGPARLTRSQRGFRGQRGFVLIFVLWILAGCSLLLASYAQSAGKTTVTESLATIPLRQRELENVADFVASHMGKTTVTADSRWQAQNSISEIEYSQSNGVSAAVAQLAETLNQVGFKIEVPNSSTTTNRLSSLRQSLSEIPEGKSSSFTQEALFSIGNNQTLTIGGKVFSVTVLPVSARPNLNTLPPLALKRYLQYLGLSEIRAEALIIALRHWRGDASVAGAGVPEAVYNAAASPYKARQAVIADWSELYWLAGSSPDLVDFLRQNFSLAGTDSRVSLKENTADIIGALADLRPSEVQRAIDHLNGEKSEQILSDVIGVTAAAKFDQAVMTSAPETMPLTIQVSEKPDGGGLAQTVVYEPRSRVLSDSWAGTASPAVRMAPPDVP